MATYNGDYYNNIYKGTSGKDEIAGFDGDDQLSGAGGDDYIYGGTNQNVGAENYGGVDYLDGGSGNDHLFGGGQADVLEGGSGNDVLSGDAGNDVLRGGTGQDVFVFGGHNGTETDEILDFTVKDDKIDLSAFGISSFDTVQQLLGGGAASYGTDGAVLQMTGNYITQTIIVDGLKPSDLTAANFKFATDTGNDTISGTATADDQFGGKGNDNLSGLSGNDRLFGESGNDELFGGDATATNQYDGSDQLYGGSGNDYLHGGSGDDYLDGGTGDDKLIGNSGSDVLFGGDGHDRFIMGTLKAQNVTEVRDFDKTADKIDLSHTGISDMDMVRDLLTSNHGNTQAVISQGGFSLTMILDNVDKSSLTSSMFIFDDDDKPLISGGGAWNEDLFGSVAKDTMSGGDGDDHLWGGAGNDKLYGGAQSGTETELYGGNDVLKGGAGDDKLYGGGGNDVLVGGDGNDVIDGGNGSDTLTGGTGKDVFLYMAAGQSVGYSADHISDFTHGQDKIDVSAIDAKAGGTDNAFKWDGLAATSATPAEGHLAYNYVNGFTHIFGSVDGSSVSLDIYLTGHLELGKSDFVL